MAVIVTEIMSTYHSPYSPVVVKMNSDVYQEDSHRFVVRIIDRPSNKLFRELRVASDENGYGVIDISRIIADKVDYYLNFGDNNAIVDPKGAYYQYTIKIGEEYIKDWSFDDYEYLNQDGKSKVVLKSNTINHHYSPGDTIRVRLTNIYNNKTDLLNGYYIVESAPTTKKIVLKGLDYYTINGSPAGGKTRYADNRRTQILDQYTKNDVYAINMSLDRYNSERYGNNLRNFTLLATIDLIKFAAPRRIRVTEKQFFYLSHIEVLEDYFIRVKNSRGEEYYQELDDNYKLNSLGVGPGNFLKTGWNKVNPSSPNNPIENVDYYEVWITNNDSSKTSQRLLLTIDKRCRWNDTQILFLDRYGNFSSFAFQLKQKNGINIEKSGYDKYSENRLDGGWTDTNSSYERYYTLNTNWMTEEENLFFEQLLTSRVHFIQLPTYTVWGSKYQEWHKITVEEKSAETQTYQNSRLIMRTLTIKMAFKENIN